MVELRFHENPNLLLNFQVDFKTQNSRKTLFMLLVELIYYCLKIFKNLKHRLEPSAQVFENQLLQIEYYLHWHLFKVHLNYIDKHVTHFYLISGVQAFLQINRAAYFQMFRWSSFVLCPDPGHHPVRRVGSSLDNSIKQLSDASNSVFVKISVYAVFK